jgi:putative endonuclease
MICYVYILKCGNGQYYTGSTKNLELRVHQHSNGQGANFTRKHQPVKLVYAEEFDRVDQAFMREKQIQNWSRRKKEALMDRNIEGLKRAAQCLNETSSKNNFHNNEEE